jgi:acetyltransferase
LKEVVPEFGNVGNPLDVTGQAVFQTEILGRSIDLLAETPGVDVILYGRSHPARMDAASPVGRILQGAAERHPHTVVLAMSLVGGHYFPYQSPDIPLAEPTDRLYETPFLQSSEYGLKAVAALIRYAEFLRARGGKVSPRPRKQVDLPAGPLSERASKQVLAHYGIPVTREQLCTSADEAVAAAAEIGYPVVLKLEAPGLLHKTEAGAVILNVTDPTSLRVGFEHLRALNVPDARGVLVQEMVPAGVELMLGMTRDPQFGPVIAVGLGGIFVEILEDVQLLLPPVSEQEVRAALQRVRGSQVLYGARGRAPADIDALVQAILNFSHMCLDLQDRVDEIDVNPLMVLPQGVRAVDALIVPTTQEVRSAHGPS